MSLAETQPSVTEGSDTDDVFAEAPGAATPITAQKASSIPEMFKRSSKRRREKSGSPQNSDLLVKIQKIVAQENSKLREELKREQQELIDNLKDDFKKLAEELKTQITTLGCRIRELETHVRDRDQLIDQLEEKVSRDSRWCEEQQDAVDDIEQKMRSAELILSGPAVPPAPRSAGPDGTYAPEDVRRTAAEVIRRAFSDARPPRSGATPDQLTAFREQELAEARRLGPKTLLCRFLCSGAGTTRDTMLSNKVLLRSLPSVKTLFVNESLSKRRQGWLRVLTPLRKQKLIHAVFSRYGNVYVKESENSQKLLINSDEKVHHLLRQYV